MLPQGGGVFNREMQYILEFNNIFEETYYLIDINNNMSIHDFSLLSSE